MAKSIYVTKASGDLYNETDQKMLINADNIKTCRPVGEESIGNSKITFNDGTSVLVNESLDELHKIINSK